MHEFEVVASETISEHPIIALRRDQVTMPHGRVASREIVEHFGAVAIAAINAHGEIALIKQYRHSVARRMWEIPAGLLDDPAESELTAAQREIIEEAGLKAQNWSVLVDFATSPGFCDEAIRVFLATDLHEVERPEPEDEEADLVLEWVALDVAIDMILAGEIVNATAIAGIFAANEVYAGKSKSRDVSVPFDLRPQALPKRKA